MDREEFQSLKAKLQNEGMVPLKIISESMEPVLTLNTNYKVASLAGDPSKFDIIVFLRDQRLVAHYIWRINTIKGVSYTTRSLQDPHKDEIPVESQDILGILVGKRLNFFRKLMLKLKYA